MKKKNSNLRSAGLLLVLILMLMIGLIYINNSNSIRSSSSAQLKSLQLLGRVEAVDKDSMLESMEGLLIEAAGTVIKARNVEGKAVWSNSLPGKIVQLKRSASWLYIVDDTKKLYCMSVDGKLLWDKTLQGDVSDLHSDRKGKLLIDYAGQEGSKIEIINHQGVDEGLMTLDHAKLLDFAAGENENSIVVIDLSSDIIKSKIITLSTSGEMRWSENFDNQIIPIIDYGKEDTLIAIGEKVIYKYKGESKKLTKQELNKTIYRAHTGEAGTAILTKSKTGYELLTYDGNLKEIGRTILSEAPSGIVSNKNNYILFYGELLLQMDIKGNIKSEYKSIPNINKVYFTEDGNIIAVSDRLIQKLSNK